MGERPGSDTKLKSVGGFEIIHKVGQGAMGAVFKARQKSLDRIVALKLLPPKIAKNKGFIRRFVREARASAKLSHPNVVAGIDVGQDGPTELWYFAMEFVDGPAASELLKKKGRLPEDEALKIARDIAGALDCARQNGLVHRDVKPDNILLTGDGTAKLADLGLVRHQQDDAGLTQSGAPMGTPFYMAPELVRGEVDSLDTRADLYGLGATLFHLVTGQPPFQGETSAVVMAKHLSDPPPLANHVCSEVSSGCSKLIQKLMQKEKSQRLQTPRELLEQLDRLLTLPASGRSVTTGARSPINGATTAASRAHARITAQRGAIHARSKKPEFRPAQQSPAAMYAAIVGGVVLLGVVFAFISSSQGPQVKQRPRVSNDPVGPTPGHQERPATVNNGPTLEQRWREAKAFAKANPNAFDQILQRFQQVADAAAGRPLAIEIKTASRKVEANYEKAAQDAWQLTTLKINGRVAVGDYDGALAVMEALPSALATRLIDRIATRRQAIEDEANGKFAPVLEKARAASAAADPAAGLAALAKAPTLKFQPATKRIAELKQQLESELANADQLRAKKAQREADTKLKSFLHRFDEALLSKKNETAAGRVAREAKTAKELDPVRTKADAMAAIIDAVAAERRRQNEAAKSMIGKPFTVGKDSGTIEQVANGVLSLKITKGDGKITAFRKHAIADLSQKQKDALFPPLKNVPAALTVREALRKLVTGQEDLDAADALLASVPDFPLTQHYHERIKAQRTVLAESLAAKAWAELVSETAKPLAAAKQALPLYKKLQTFLQKYSKTEFARTHASEISKVKTKLEAIAAPNLDIEVVNVSGESVQPGKTQPSTIPAEAKRFNGHAYHFFKREMTWEDAKAFCEQQGGYLACAETSEESEFLSGIAKERCWVGGSRSGGDWTWVNGARFERSIARMSIGDRGNQIYLTLDGTRYRDLNERRMPFICEWEPTAVKPEEAEGTPEAPGPTGARFVGEDEQTQGNWKERYGKDGYMLASDQTRLPAYAKLTTRNEVYVWKKETDDHRALKRAQSEERAAACWFGRRAPIVFDLEITDGREHNVSLYLLEFNSDKFTAKVDLLDPTTEAVLDTRTVRRYRRGKYLTWRVKGRLRIRISPVDGSKYSLVSGVFFK